MLLAHDPGNFWWLLEVFFSMFFDVLKGNSVHTNDFPFVITVLCMFNFGGQAVICVFLESCSRKIPEGSRVVKSGWIWLLMIPGFKLLWNFFLYPKIVKSLTQVSSKQEENVGAGAIILAWIYSVLAIFGPILFYTTPSPSVGFLVEVVSLMFLGMLLLVIAVLANAIA